MLELYALPQNEFTNEMKSKDLYIMGFCYLHGELEDLNNGDLFALSQTDIEAIKEKEYFILPCVVDIRGEKIPSKFYFWKKHINRGLVCAKNDKVANEEARKLYNKRSMWI